MTAEGSVTHWFKQLEQGDSAAIQAVWERYFPQLVRPGIAFVGYDGAYRTKKISR